MTRRCGLALALALAGCGGAEPASEALTEVSTAAPAASPPLVASTPEQGKRSHPDLPSHPDRCAKGPII